MLYGVAAIEKHALVAVDVGNLRLAAPRRGVSGVEGEVAEVLVQIPDVDDFRPRRAAQQRERRLLPRRVVDDGHVLVRFQLGHTFIPSLEGAVKGPVSGRENRPRPGVYQFAPARSPASSLARSPLYEGGVPAASVSRPSVSARPRIAIASKMGGEVPAPVSAARSGCATLPSFRFRVSAKARTQSSRAAAFQP